jgi:hypothetical protein
MLNDPVAHLEVPPDVEVKDAVLQLERNDAYPGQQYGQGTQL